MESVPKDLLFDIALNLNTLDLINFCKVQKRHNQYICNSERFWKTKLLKDYPNYEEIGNKQDSFKYEYIKVHLFYTFIDRKAQELINKYFGDAQVYMNKNKYIEDFRKNFLNMYLFVLRHIKVKDDKIDSDSLYEAVYLFMNSGFNYTLLPKIIVDIVNGVYGQGAADRLNEEASWYGTFQNDILEALEVFNNLDIEYN
jgi:hypothetical protein